MVTAGAADRGLDAGVVHTQKSGHCVDDVGRQLSTGATVLQSYVRHDRHARRAHLVRRQAGRQSECRQRWISGIDVEQVERLDTECRG